MNVRLYERMQREVEEWMDGATHDGEILLPMKNGNGWKGREID